ncbi:MAG TPA: PilZ domain-containing protein [Accumulibacter sp.]|jgi:hypothetical protein|nr:PilZ domain-containing protein [Accumulibacter sp.]HQC79619.1 PilZ domain-containing protein [Accumulibacter sp.]
MSEERRHYLRIAFDAPALLLADAEDIPVRVLDLSFKGALIELPADVVLRRGEASLLRIELDEEGNEIRIESTVVHLQDRLAGLVCHGLDIDSATHLRRLVELNLGRPDLLERELSALLAG